MELFHEKSGSGPPHCMQFHHVGSVDKEHKHTASAKQEAAQVVSALPNVKHRSDVPHGQKTHDVALGRHPSRYSPLRGLQHDNFESFYEKSGFGPPHSMQFHHVGSADKEHKHVASTEQEAVNIVAALSSKKWRLDVPNGQRAHDAADRHLNDYFPYFRHTFNKCSNAESNDGKHMACTKRQNEYEVSDHTCVRDYSVASGQE
ncbi:hypothetical protein KIN20_038259 [Parelaphostrongylus tenuis]|uniref:Uncharacterized protein n=1 Tax=Parelaphostrongylus tenuis TaxID=148309 RepID=A0AAD5WLN1_PARTN|nr:hypothetical protein KIN20_038259 [Parelaphostrongylus tenuis]